MHETNQEVNLVWVGLIVEGGLVLVALVLAYFGLFDHQQYLREIDAQNWKDAFLYGSAATVPLLLFLAIFHFFPTNLLQPMREFVEQKLYPLFRGSTITELLLLSVMAGFGEELLFRWSIQGGIATLLQESAGDQLAMAIGLGVASILFGLCHWVNSSYGLTTLAVGVYLGLTMIWTGTFLVPAVTHTIYDFVALMYIVRMNPQVTGDELIDE